MSSPQTGLDLCSWMSIDWGAQLSIQSMEIDNPNITVKFLYEANPKRRLDELHCPLVRGWVTSDPQDCRGQIGCLLMTRGVKGQPVLFGAAVCHPEQFFPPHFCSATEQTRGGVLIVVCVFPFINAAVLCCMASCFFVYANSLGCHQTHFPAPHSFFTSVSLSPFISVSVG